MGDKGGKKDKDKAKKQKQGQVEKKQEQQKSKLPTKNPVQGHGQGGLARIKNI